MIKHNILEIWNENKYDYTDYKLGKDIEECLIRKGYCNFQAEL
jgi:hypothetical protein